MKNVLEVVDYLLGKGYKCGKSAMYNHVKRGLIVKRDGEFLAKDVDKFAALYLARESGGADNGQGSGDDLEQLQRDKLAADAMKAKAQAEHWELKTRVEKGQYIERDLFFGEMAARAAILKNDLENMIRSGAGTMVQACDGDLAKIPDVIDLWLKKLEVYLGRYAENKVWKVPGHGHRNETEVAHDES
jgi:hypothetical protein